MSAFDKLEFELYAPLSLNSAFPEFVKSLVKGESPDWQDEINSIGIEVARAENNHIGYTNNIANLYLGKPKHTIPSKVEQSFKGDLYFDENTGKLVSVSDSKGLVDGNRPIKLAIKKATDKLNLLNKSHYRSFKKNCLYMFLITSVDRGNAVEFLEEYINMTQKYDQFFSDVFLMAFDCIYWIDTIDQQITKYVLSESENSTLNAQVHLLRNVSEWKTGTPFANTYKSILR